MIMSVQEARKILGKGAKSLGDDDISKIINELDDLAIQIIKNAKVLTSSVY